MLDIREVARVTREFAKLLPILSYKLLENEDRESIATIFEETVERCADSTMIVFEGRELSWSEFNALANQMAHALQDSGVQHGDCVAVIMENRVEMLAGIVALFKLGATAGLINNGLTGRQLAHCIETVGSVKCLVGEEVFSNIADVRDELSLAAGDYLWVADQRQSEVPEWALDFCGQVANYPDTNLPQTADVLAGETALYIFTSGTTGLPKAAKMPHRKYLASATGFGKLGYQAQESDRIYVCLPLYHGTALIGGFGASLTTGASIFLKRKFSASDFWPEVQKHQTNCFVYVGELCRYLLAQPLRKEEKNNPLVKVLGNGLRPDIWDEFKERFGIERVSEFYGASEGNVSFINALNKNRTMGLSAGPVLVIEYDVDQDEIVRNRRGRVIRVKRGESGLLLGKINDKFKFDGYSSAAASETKVLRNVIKKGDAWFNTGDLVCETDVGFAMGLAHYQFVDRVGDTFRWRSENVSTNEVGEILNRNEQVEVANVYGVDIPGADGKAGMVSLELKPGVEFDAVEFASYVTGALAPFAQPVFVRIQQHVSTTGTFKLVKGELRKQAYDMDEVDDDLYVMPARSKSYQKLDREYYKTLTTGAAGY